MAMPIIDETSLDNAKDELAVERLAGSNTGLAVAENSTALATRNISNVDDTLRDLGFGDQVLNFTSFPIITLNNGVFSSPEQKGFGVTFDCIIHSDSKSHLYSADKGRDQDPEVIYSSDNEYVNSLDGSERKLVTDQVKEWEAQGWPVDHKIYHMVMAEMLNEPHDGEFVFLQISPASQGKLGGYLRSLIIRGHSPNSVVTRVSMGASVGSGTKEFNPWVFKMVSVK